MHSSLFIFTLIPSFLIAFIAAKTSSDIKRFFAFEVPFANEANKTHLILRLLSPGTSIVVLKFVIFFFYSDNVWHSELVKFKVITKICIFCTYVVN